MKKKLLLTLSLVFFIICIFAVTVSAEVFDVTYWDGGTKKETYQTDGNGVITLLDTRFSDENAPIFNWFTYEGDVYAPGETITVTKNTDIRQFCAYESTNLFTNHTNGQWGWRYIQLQEDLHLESTLYLNDGGRLFIDLNGYNIYSSANDVFNQRRAGLFIVGKGSVIHTGEGHIFTSQTHGYGDGNVGMVVGRDVTISTGGTVMNYINSLSSDHISSTVPFYFYGSFVCKQLMSIGQIKEITDVIIDPAYINVTGEKIFSFGGVGTGGDLTLTIGDGTFILTEAANSAEYWTSGYGDSCTVITNGGSFTNGADIVLGFAPQGSYKVESTVGDMAFSTIVTGGCEHKYTVTSNIAATCVNLHSVTHTCSVCADSFTISAGTLTDHTYKIIKHTPATETSAGEKTFECTVCKKLHIQIYSLDPNEFEITVTVLTEGGEKQITAKVGDVLDLTYVETFESKIYTLVGIKDFGEYTSANVVSIEIPMGIAKVAFASDNKALKSISLKDQANVIFSSFSKCTALTEISIGKSVVVFENGCSNNVIQAIRSDVEGANVTFKGATFNGKSSLTVLTMSAYSDYDFGGNSFKNTGIKELIFPDYSRPVFRDEAAFYNCAAEYLYVGRGITHLMGKPFDYCQKMQKIVLMEVKSFTHEYTFCVENGGEKPVEVYIHSEEISLPNNTFYQCHGITIYTNAAITNGSAFNGCGGTTKGGITYPSYTIIYGIPHKYTEGYSSPTCTTDGSNGYVTDCPCGEVSEASYKKFVGTVTTSENYEDGEIITTVIPAMGHGQGALVDVLYLNGYLQSGLARYECTRCVNNGYYEEMLNPIMTWLGYSASEFGDKASMVKGYDVDNYSIELLKKANPSFSYGMVIKGNISGETQHPLTIQDGVVVAENGTKIMPITTNYCRFEIGIKGIGESLRDTNIIFCMYVFDGTAIKYIDDGEEKVGVAGNSYNSFIAPQSAVEKTLK